MKSTRFLTTIAILIAGIIAAACAESQASSNKQINNFEECAEAGNPIMESYPRQCRADGKTFVEEINKEMTIETRAGQLTLSYHDGKAALSGILNRGTPCVNWTVEITATKDLPTSNVNINIFNSNKDVICIQVVGEPQKIKETIIQVSENTKYTVIFEDKTVFSGTLSEGGSI